jgi:poly(3-hydroxybutyrate) depolymerase
MNKLMIHIILCVLTLTASVHAQVQVSQINAGTIYHFTLRDDAFWFDHADYSVFIPEGVTTIKGVFIHQHGCSMEGVGASTAYDIQYQMLAKKWGLAVVGPDLYPKKGGDCGQWIKPESGSAQALIKAIEIVGKTSGHPEMKDASWLLWGHSGGGYWTLSMLRDYPEKILAAFAYSPAFDPQWDYPQGAAKVPLMIRHAGKDDFNAPSADCWRTAVNTFDKLRKMDGYVSIACNDGQNHNFSYVRYMAIPFYESVMAQRLPEKKSGTLRDIRPELVWLGDTASLNIFKASSYAGDQSAMCRFPDSLSAAKWREYVITGTVVDHTPPPAPYAVKINRISGNQAELTWEADADIESGIRHFIIRVNGKPVAQFPSSDAYQRLDANGDNTIPFSLPELKCVIFMPWQETECTVSVSTVNHFNLESESCTTIFKIKENNSNITPVQ